MRLHHLLSGPSILDQFMFEIRDKNIQKDAMRFRKNIECVGEIMGYEISKTLEFKKDEVATPLAKKNS